MTMTKQTVAMKIASYLGHDISLADLVSWAEDAMMDGEFDENEAAAIPDVVSRLGVADVRAFGLDSGGLDSGDITPISSRLAGDQSDTFFSWLGESLLPQRRNEKSDTYQPERKGEAANDPIAVDVL